MCSYSLGVANYRIAYPPKNYPPTSPYTSLSNHFKSLVKNGLVHRVMIKALLYPELIRKANLEIVRLRRHHHRGTSFRRRQSICSSSELSRNESDSNACDTSASSSIGFIRCFPNQNQSNNSATSSQSILTDYGADVDCTKEIFAQFESSYDKFEKVPVVRDSDGSLLFTHETNDCDIESRDSLKYYSKPVRVVIERRPTKTDSLIHTSTAQMIIGNNSNEKDENPSNSKGSPSDDSVLSEFNQRSIRGNMAFEDLVNIDESIKIKNSKPSVVDERHSAPTFFVGNRFNCSSLTEVFIPLHKEKIDVKHSENTSNETLDGTSERNENTNYRISCTSTHSSSIDIPPIVPAPDQLSIELLYNLHESSPENTESNHLVIKPPSMFDGHKSVSRELTPLKLNQTIQNHRSKSNRSNDKTSLSKSTEESALNPPKKCVFCTRSPCISQRSSDSGMAGSCSISSPDAPIINAGNEYDQLEEHHLPDIEQRLNGLMHSKTNRNFNNFTETQTFADSNHDSGQYGNEESENEQHRDSSAVKNMFELSSSQDTVKRKSNCQSSEPTATEQKSIENNEEKKVIFKTGLYAHWWKKEQLPSEILRDIHRMKQNSVSRQSTVSGGSGKKLIVSFDCLMVFVLNERALSSIIHFAF